MTGDSTYYPVCGEGSVLDTRNGLSNGLQFAWFSGTNTRVTQSKGASGMDLVRNLYGITNNAETQKVTQKEGHLYGVTGGGGISFGRGVNAQVAPMEKVSGVTVMVVCKQRTTAVSGTFFGNLVTNDGWAIKSDTNGQFLFTAGDGTTANSVTTSGDISGKWHSVVGVHTSNVNTAIYVDGTEQANNSGFGDMEFDAATQFLSVGADGAGGTTMDGAIACALYWDRVLSDSEIRSISNDPYQVLTTFGPWETALAHTGFPLDVRGCAKIQRVDATCTITMEAC
jgi:hypothetical protein